MTGQSRGESKSVGLYSGTGHTEDYGSLRVCRTTDCPVDFTSSAVCRHCGEKTDPDAYRCGD